MDCSIAKRGIPVPTALEPAATSSSTVKACMIIMSRDGGLAKSQLEPA
jgi:hypothetical protein